MRCDEGGVSLRLSLLSFILLTCCRYRSRRERIFTVFVGSRLVSSVFSSRTVYTERTNSHPESGRGAGWSESCCGQGSVRWVLLKVSTILMSDHDDLDDFPTENINISAESIGGAFRAESTGQRIAASGITSNFPPLFDVSTSWFIKYEELLEDWLDLTVLEVSKRGLAQKNRLVGVAEKYKGLFNREPLRADDGVKNFRDTLRPQFVKGAQSVFLW